MPKEYPDAFGNPSPDINSLLTCSELMELSNLKEIRLSLAVIMAYLENRESIIFAAARVRADEGGRGDVR
jgi:hypothetical protein